MMRSAWLRLWFLWAVPAAIVAANVLWLVAVRGAFVGRGSMLERHTSTLEADVAKLTSQRDALRSSRSSLATLQHDLGALRQDQLGSMRERLVSFLVDLARRTQAAGLSPDRLTYSVERDPKTGLVHFAATFSVTGTYEQVRRCVNLLETSPQFVLVERLSLRQDDTSASLAVGVQISVGTFFADADTGMLRQLGIENLPEVASAPATATGRPPAAVAAAAGSPADNRPTDFSSVDAKVMDDLRSAVNGLSSGEAAADEDVFVPPAGSDQAPRRRPDAVRPPADKGSRSSFFGQVGRRDVSGGR